MAETIIRATCTECGDVELEPTQVELRICSRVERSVYAFVCPSCEMPVIKPADARAIELLRSAGVPSIGWDTAAEIEERPDGPPLTNDDVLDFMLALEEPDWVARLITADSHS